MNARRIIAAGILAAAVAACGSGSPTFSDPGVGEPEIPVAPPTDTAGFIPPEMGV